MPKKSLPTNQCESIHPRLGIRCQLEKGHPHSHQANDDKGLGHGWNDPGPSTYRVGEMLEAGPELRDPQLSRIQQVNLEVSKQMSMEVAKQVESHLRAIPGLDQSAAEAIQRLDKRVRELETENTWLKDELMDVALDAFHERAFRDKETGWYCSNYRGAAVYWGDILVKMGHYEKDETRGHGRVQYYRPVARDRG